ncbi:MAG: hypothetical protein LC640_11220, partial [Frankia sp.]|nr:hypothetical protein [Frankia sp.]
MTWRQVLGWAGVAAIVEYVFLLAVVVREVIPPVVVIGVVIGVGTLLLRRGGKAGVIVTLVGFVLFVASNLAFAGQDLFQPAALLSFWVAFVALITAIVGLVSAIATLMGRSGFGAARRTALAAVVVSIVGMLGGVVTALTYDDATRSATDTVVIAKDVKFPTTLDAKAGTVTFFLD